jgi:hypothetical protein
MTPLRKTLRVAVRIALAILPWLTILSALVLQPG